MILKYFTPVTLFLQRCVLLFLSLCFTFCSQGGDTANFSRSDVAICENGRGRGGGEWESEMEWEGEGKKQSTGGSGVGRKGKIGETKPRSLNMRVAHRTLVDLNNIQRQIMTM